MKKITSIILCVILLAAMSFSISAQATDFIGMRFDTEENSPAGYNNLEVSIYEGALRTTTTVASDSHIIFNCSFNSSEYKYIAIMYRANHDISTPWFYLKDETMGGFAPTEGTFTAVGWAMDNEWHKAIYSIEESFPALVNKNITGLRLPCGDLVGDTVDFLYICFFKTQEDAEAFNGFVDEATTNEPETDENITTEEPGDTNSETTAPPTGDNSRIVLWTVISIISFVGIISIALAKKKRVID